MRRFTCEITFKCDNILEINEYMRISLNKLGFVPKVMSFVINEFKPMVENIEFNTEILFSMLKKRPSCVELRNQPYTANNDSSNRWFRMEISTNQYFDIESFSLVWSNLDLKFLLENDSIYNFLDASNLIFGYCGDQYDIMQETNSDIETFKKENPEHWGRMVSRNGFQIIAAPIMWFGPQFHLISKNKLIKFDKVKVLNLKNTEVIQIILFDLYDIPNKEENRLAQRKYWKFFELSNIIKNININTIDTLSWLKERALNSKKIFK